MDLKVGAAIKQTKQTNDIVSVETRQTNYTNQFDLPMTDHNVAAMKHLSLVGNTSNIPYQKNECYLYSSTGECFVYKGWAIIKQSTNVYKCYVYDGNLELYKAVENFLLSDLDLTELTHAKDLNTVLSSQTNQNYRYIFADFNGDTGEDIGKINIDYLVPSVRVKYLWNKIFETFGFTYSGSIFQTQEFDNLWMTYPKGINTSDSEIIILQSDDYTFLAQVVTFISSSYFAKAEGWTTNELINFNNGVFMRVGETATYRLDISGMLQNFESIETEFQIIIAKNAEAYYPNSNDVPSTFILASQSGFFTEEAFETAFTFELNQYDSIAIILKRKNSGDGEVFILDEETSSLQVTLSQLDPNNVDFSEAFIDFSITDFVKDIMGDFGLSLFKDKYTNNYKFLTMAERLQSAEVLDWSDKYDRKLSENYIHGNYAQQNIFRHKYNDDEDNYNDGSISIDNVNLPDKRPLIQSKIYTPERLPVEYFGHQINQYKLFDKEIKETSAGQEITYKSLSGRFYFLRCELKVWVDGIPVVSKQLGTEQIINSLFIASYWKLSKKDLVNEYWLPIISIFNKALLVKTLNNLSEIDICKLDFTKLIYYEQEQAYFLLNKVEGYVPGSKTIAELIRIDRSQFSTSRAFVNFGFGVNQKSVEVGDVVDVWLTGVFNLDTYEIDVEGALKISDYHYQVVAENAGDLNVVVTIKNKKTEKVVVSSDAVLSAVISPE